MAGASDPDIIMTIDCLFVPRWLGVLCNNNIGLGLTFSNYWTVTVQKISVTAALNSVTQITFNSLNGLLP